MVLQTVPVSVHPDAYSAAADESVAENLGCLHHLKGYKMVFKITVKMAANMSRMTLQNNAF